MARQLLNKYLGDSVSADGTDVYNVPDIPTGETWHLTRFGGAALDSALIALQKRIAVSPAEWITLRAGVGPGHFEWVVDQDFIGDGVVDLRVVRQEKSGSAQALIAWIEGYKMV